MKLSRLASTCAAAVALFASALFVGSPFSASVSAQGQAVPEIAFDSANDYLQLPADLHLGEVAGVATTSTGNLWIYYRGGGPNATIGASRNYINGGARLIEVDKAGKFLREIGAGENDRPYSFLFAQGVRVDAQNNFWIIDRASRVVAKFAANGRELMNLGRRPEAIGEVGSSAGGGGARGAGAPAGAPGAAPGGGGREGGGRGEGRGAGAPAGAPGAPAAAPGGGGGGGGRGGGGAPGLGTPGDNFNQPTDVAWDAAGNIFITDAYVNNRVAKFDKNGRYYKSWGGTGSGPGQFNTPHSIAVDAAGNVYVADMGNKRIQVFDNNGTFKSEITNVGAPRALCITPGPNQFLYSSNSNPTEDPFLGGEIYKLQLNGTVVGKIGKAGKQWKEFGMVNAIDCREPNTLYVAELMNWRVQKLTLK